MKIISFESQEIIVKTLVTEKKCFYPLWRWLACPIHCLASRGQCWSQVSSKEIAKFGYSAESTIETGFRLNFWPSINKCAKRAHPFIRELLHVQLIFQSFRLPKCDESSKLVWHFLNWEAHYLAEKSFSTVSSFSFICFCVWPFK